jgi:hypothetical protein
MPVPDGFSHSLPVTIGCSRWTPSSCGVRGESDKTNATGCIAFGNATVNGIVGRYPMRYGSATMDRKPKLPQFADDRLVKSEQVNLRMSKALIDAIDAAAAEDGKQVSDWIRDVLIRELRERHDHGA